jgi:uncharacterized membrane protein YedE/YeeE
MDWSSIFPMGMAHYLIGGLLIGAGVSWLFVSTGLMGGASSFLTTVWTYVTKDERFNTSSNVSSRTWRNVYALGLALGALIGVRMLGLEMNVTEVSPWQLAIGGLITGFGVRLSSGCTSGHGICGMALLDLDSILAVLVFLSTAIAVAHLVTAFGGVA